MQRHFVCAECGSVSHFSGTCQNELCVKQGVRLTECHCEDDSHDMVIRHHSESDEDQTEEKSVKKSIEEALKNDYSVTTIDLDNEESAE